MRIKRFLVLAMSIVAMAGLGASASASAAGDHGKRDPLDEQDVRTGGAAHNFVEEHFPGTYGGYWVRPIAMEGPFTFHFAWTAGMDKRLEMLNERFPLNRGKYVVVENDHSWRYLLKLQRRIGWLTQRIRRGEVKAPGVRPWQISSEPEPERDCVMLYKGPLEKKTKKWWKHRFGDSICMTEAYVGG